MRNPLINPLPGDITRCEKHNLKWQERQVIEVENGIVFYKLKTGDLLSKVTIQNTLHSWRTLHEAESGKLEQQQKKKR